MAGLVNGDGGLRTRSVVLSGAVALLLCYAGLRWWSAQGRPLPQNTWLSAAMLVLICAALLAAAGHIRAYVHQRTSARVISPQFGRGVVVAARACAVGGAIASGWYLAQALVRLPNAGISSQSSAMWLALGLAAASALVAGSGLLAQSWCRLPPQDDDPPRPEGGAAAAG